ncbi:MAG: hypothetical protein WBW61_08595 [Rhodanobacteraceae bacterium]
MPTPCLSESLQLHPAGDYSQRVIVVPRGEEAQPFLAAVAPLTVAPSMPGGEGPVPISGLVTSNWYDPVHSGEGIIVQVAAYPPTDDGTVYKELVWDWFTYDTSGHPFWISGNATIDPDDPITVTSSAVYSNNGGFAGDFGANAVQIAWGTLTFSFPDLDHMTVDYDGSFGFDAPRSPALLEAPTGTGALHYQRLLNIDGLGCDPDATNCTQ